jgi:N-terminal acetyltransferase B complex non-catalytic subunit
MKDQNLAQKVTLPLAEKYCQKFFDENKIEAEAEVELYLMILEKQKKYKEMLSIIESPIGDKLSNHLDFLSKRKAELLRLQGKHREAFDAYKTLIENNIDQIEYYLELYNISNILDENELDMNNDLAIDQKQNSYNYLSSVIALIEKCIERGKHEKHSMKSYGIKSSQRQRGPYLAKMVLYQLIKKRQQTQGNCDHLLKRIANSITDLLFDYFVEFGSKHACIYDMYYILDKTDLTKDESDYVSLLSLFIYRNIYWNRIKAINLYYS